MKKYICLIIFAILLFTNSTAAFIDQYSNNQIIQKTDLFPPTLLPSSFSWRDINGTDFTTSIKDQTPIPSCETFAFVAAVETMLQYQIGFPFECDLSEAHLFFYSDGNVSWGSYPEDNADFLLEYGVPDEACWPYPTIKYQYPLNTTAENWQNRTVKISEWNHLPNNRDAIKQAIIDHGPVIGVFQIFEDFMIHSRGIYQHRWGKSLGPHIIAIVGYNDDPGYWVCKNSWGTEWGEQGWFRIRYGECLIESHCISIVGVKGTYPIIYVDDDNIAGPWDGTMEHPYSTIQQGIDHAYEGYMVYVFNGTYQENIVINKSIQLFGEDPQTTVIDGGLRDDVIFILAKDTTVSGFTIQNSGLDLFDAGIEVRLGPIAGDIVIENNIIQNNTVGIYVYGSSGNTIKGNSITHNDKGISLLFSVDNVIQYNDVSDNDRYGIHSDWSQSTYQYNIITDNQLCGIFLNADSNKNKVTNNHIIQNGIGMAVTDSHLNVISNNNLYANGLSAWFSNSLLNIWRRNCWNDRLRIGPKLVFGKISNNHIPWVQIDFRPARKPYIIPWIMI
jgi:parallel beta-helix repeat protein